MATSNKYVSKLI